MDRLGVLGDANLFFLNPNCHLTPNGILFGPNASLDVNGSFVASTARGVQFADGTTFSTDPTTPPLLSVTVPVGLGFGSQPAPIRIRSTASAGLQVPEGQSLVIAGGMVRLGGGRLQPFPA